MDGLDGILNHENEELRDRVAVLERKVQLQEDEVICLKSALSDCLRRLQALENGRAMLNTALPSKPAFRTPSTPRKVTASRPTQNRHSTSSVEGPSPARSPQPSRIVPRHSSGSGPPGGGGSLSKWPSVPSQNTANGHLSPSRSQLSVASAPQRARSRTPSVCPEPKIVSASEMSSAREPSFSPDEGCLRMYMRGRAINVYAPSSMTDYDVSKLGQASKETLKLEWVYGYRGRDCRNNLYQLPTGELVYFTAAVVVLYNVQDHMQRHYLGHTDDVKCLAVHPDKITIATGQVAGHDKKEGRGGKKDVGEMLPHVRIWDSVSLNTLHLIGLGDFERGVACLSFSKADGGSFLAVIDEANEHVISLWEWNKGDRGHKITETKSSTEPMLVVEFHPLDKNTIVTCGKSHLAFWTLEGGTLTKKMGIFDKYDKPKFVTCMAFSESGDLVTGDSNGNLLVWSRGNNRISQAVTGAHEGGIFSICILKDGTLLTGGKDRCLVQWSADYQRTGVEYEIPEQFGPVRMLSQGRGNMIIVGTTRNCILQGSLHLKFTPIVQGHMDELWGLACHPNQNQFVTCSYDRLLYLWDTLSHSAVWTLDLPDGGHCACFHPGGNIVVVGTVTARWLVIDVTTREIISTRTDGNEQLECVKFSPDGTSLAIGSRDNFIYIYSVTEDGCKYQRVGRCSGHSSFVTHLDWSQDGQYLQSNSGDYEVLFWNGQTCKQITSPTSVRDVEWATHDCTLGFNVCGIWPEGADGTDVNACSRSKGLTMVASGDDFGKVNLYAYPCCQPKSTAHIYGGHSSHVTNVNFLHDDSRLLSTGGKDTAIMQWEVI